MWQRSPLTPLPSILAATFINHDVEAYKIQGGITHCDRPTKLWMPMSEIFYKDPSNNSKLEEVKQLFPNSIGIIYKDPSKFKPTRWWGKGLSLTQNLGNIVETMSASCLELSALPPEAEAGPMSNSNYLPALATPLHWHLKHGQPGRPKLESTHEQPACMFFSRARVAELEHAYPMAPPRKRSAANEDSRDTSVPLVLTLGYIGDFEVKEVATRLLHVALNGLPAQLCPEGGAGHACVLQVNHKCSHRGCMSPHHTYWGTQGQNVHDMVEAKKARKKGRRGNK